MHLFAHHLWTCNPFLNTGYTSSFVWFLVVLIIHTFHACVKTVIYDELQHRPRGFLLCAWERSGRREEDWMTLSRVNWECSTWGELTQRIVEEGCCSRGTKKIVLWENTNFQLMIYEPIQFYKTFYFYL